MINNFKKKEKTNKILSIRYLIHYRVKNDLKIIFKKIDQYKLYLNYLKKNQFKININ